jgi:hypothetical protein
MKEEKALSINLDKENDPIILKKLVKFWQDKAVLSEYKLLLLRGNLSEDQIKQSVNLDRIKEIMKITK